MTSDRRRSPRQRPSEQVREAERFLYEVWGASPDTVGVLAYKKGKGGFSTAAFETDRVPEAAVKAIRLSEAGYDVYTHLCLGQEAPGAGRRLDLDTVTALNCVWAELDYGHSGHASASGAPDLQAALRLINAFPLRPTHIVSSGNGFHCYWMLTDTVWIEDDTIDDVASLLKDFGAGWQQHVKSHGYKADSVFDLARILRVPGTDNHKQPQRLKPVTLEASSPDLRYAVEDIRSVSLSSGRGKTRRRGKSTDGFSFPRRGGLLADWDRIEAGCAFVRHVRNDAATLPEPEWMITAGIAGRTRNGREHFHDISRLHPSYDADENDEKLKHAATLNPWNCATIHADHYEGCRDCPFLGASGNPVDLGRPWMGRLEVRLGAPIPDVSAAAWRGVYASQEDPTIFRRGNTTLLARAMADGCWSTELCTFDHFSHFSIRAVAFMKEQKSSDDLVEVVTPPTQNLRDMWASPNPPLPQLWGITEVPLIRPDGTIADRNGFDTASGFLIGISADLQVPSIPLTPNSRQLAKARRLLEEELLGEFDFVGDADRAHTLAALLWPFGQGIRPQLVTTPLHLISKPTPGSGGSLLVRVITLPAYGQDIGVMTEANSDAEWRKRLTSMALQSKSVVLLDNLRTTLDSGALAAALTSTRWADRVLGSSKVVDVDFAPLWVASGNNPVLSAEISRRTVQIRIDPRVDRPWQRQEWRHPQLLEWAHKNRGELVWAALVLWRNWLAVGSPNSEAPVLGSFEQWSRTIGGVLKAAGIPGFLDNLDDLYEAADEASAAERILLACWYEQLPDRPQTSAQILDSLIDSYELNIPIELAANNEKARIMETGRLLARIADRRYDVDIDGERMTLHVEKATMRNGTTRWGLVSD